MVKCNRHFLLYDLNLCPQLCSGSVVLGQIGDSKTIRPCLSSCQVNRFVHLQLRGDRCYLRIEWLLSLGVQWQRGMERVTRLLEEMRLNGTRLEFWEQDNWHGLKKFNILVAQASVSESSRNFDGRFVLFWIRNYHGYMYDAIADGSRIAHIIW